VIVFDALAGLIRSIEPMGALRGYVDPAGPERVCGWAQDADSPDEAVVLEVWLDGQPVLCMLANAYRANLRRAEMGSGGHAFDVSLPAAGAVTVRRIVDVAVLGMTEAARQRLAA
jgi:hypothetical protein